jgi:phage-related protein
MAGDFGKQIGRLHIRVLPNADKFRQDLRKDLEEAKRNLKLEVPVEADTDQADRDVKAFVRRWSKQVIRVRVTATTAVARTQLTTLSRNRTANITVKVDNKALAGAQLALARLSGFRVARDLVQDFGEKLQDLDKKAFAIGRVSLMVGNLVNVIAGAAVGLVTVASDLVKIGNLGLVLPAAFAGAAIGMATLVIALKSAKTELASLGPAFTNLQTIIQSNFWAQAKVPILDLVNSVLPGLRSGFGATATAIGSQLGVLAGAFQRTLGGGVLEGMFAKLVETINIVTTGMNPLAEAVTTLGTVGAQYLPRLATFFVQIGTAFNDWVQKSAANGDIFVFIEEGITAVKDLFRAISGIIGIFSAIDSAATAAGAGGLSSFASNMQGAAAILNSPAVQGALTTILQGVSTGLAGLGGGLGQLGSTIVALAPVIGTVLASAGQSLGAFITALSSAFAQPEFGQGLLDLFDGIYSAITSLAPAFPALGQLFGQLATTVGIFLSSVAPLLAVIKTTFAPLFDALLVAIQPLIPIFAGVLVDAVTALIPVISSLAGFISENSGAFTALIGVAVAGGTAISGASRAFTLFKTGLSGISGALKSISSGFETAKIVALYGKDLVVAIKSSGTALKIFSGIQKAFAIAQALATGAVKLFSAALKANPIGAIITLVVLLVGALIWFFTQTELGKAIFQNLQDFVGTAFKVIQDVIASVVAWITQNWQLLLAIFLGPLGLLVGFFITNFDTIKAVVTQFIANVVTLWNAFWEGLAVIVSTVWSAIALFVTTYINIVVAVITAVVAVIVGVWNAFWTGLGTIVMTVWNFIVTTVTSYIALVVSVITTVVSTIVGIWNTFWTGLATVVLAVWAGIQSVVQAAITFVQAIISNVMGIVQAIWSGNWSAIGAYVQNILDAARAFISSVLNTIRGVISSVMNSVLSTWSSIWSSILNAVSSVVNGVRGFVSGLVESVRSTIQSVVSTVSGIQSKIMGVFAGAGQWLAESGRSIIQGLIDGIKNMAGNVKNAVSGVLEAARNLLPFSPAKEGPFSGKGWTLYSGRSISEALGQGITDNVSKVRSAALKMVDAVPKSVGTEFAVSDAALSVKSASVGSDGQGDTYNIGNVGYDPQALIREVNMAKKQKLVRERLDGGVPIS